MRKGGFSIIELMIYLAVLAGIFTVFISSFLAISRSYGQLKIARGLDFAAINFFERATREIRNATSINTAESVFGASPGALTVNQVDSLGNIMNIRFGVIGSGVHIFQSGNDLGNLLPDDVTVDNLIFRSIDSGVSKGVKMEVRFKRQRGQVVRYANYYSTVVLRGTYR